MAIRFTNIEVAAAPLPCWPGAHDGGTASLADPACPALIDVAPGVEETALAHVAGATQERGGLLIGIPYRAPDSPARCDIVVRVRVLHCVPAVQSNGTPISLTMSNAVWQSANQVLRQQRDAVGGGTALDALRIVGWYHSHPGLGAFFSATDRRTHGAFFRQPWSVGWVIDPIRHEQAWFCGPDCAPARRLASEQANDGQSDE